MFINFSEGQLTMSHRRALHTLATTPDDFFNVIQHRGTGNLCCFVREKTIAGILLAHVSEAFIEEIADKYFHPHHLNGALVFDDHSRLQTKMSTASRLLDQFADNPRVLHAVATLMYGADETEVGNHTVLTFADGSAVSIDINRLEAVNATAH